MAEETDNCRLETRVAGAAVRPPSRAARITGRISLVAFPFVCIFLLEWVLRMAGLGFDPSFFVTPPTDSNDMRITNPDFGRRFFPKHMVREPVVRGILSPKPAGAFRAFVLGGSAAMGDPDASYGLARMLECELSKQFPDRRIEIVNAAMTAINSHVVLPIAKDCLRLEPDALIVYMGNNEVVGPFGLSPASPGGSGHSVLKQIGLGIRRYRIGQVISDMISRTGRRGDKPEDLSWRGMEHFLNVEVSPDDVRMKGVYVAFRRNLDVIVAGAAGAGVPVVLCTVPVNVATCPPFAGKPTEDNPPWTAAMSQGIQHEQSGHLSEAVDSYLEATCFDGDAADGWFRLGCALEKQGTTGADLELLRKALDLDRLRFRADTHLEQIIRDVADEHSRTVMLVEGAVAVAAVDKEAEPAFVDHVHLSFTGTKALSDAVYEVLIPLLNREGSIGPRERMSAAEMREILAYTDWDAIRIEHGMLNRRMRPPFTLQLDWVDPSEKIRELADQMGVEDLLSRARDAYKRSVSSRSHDPVLARNAARLLSAAGDVPGAIQQWQNVHGLQTFSPEPLLNLGNLFFEQGQSGDAEKQYRSALELRSGCAEAYNGLGRIAIKNGRLDAAETLLSMAVAAKPGLPEPHNNLATVYVRTGRAGDAVTEWRTALELRPAYTGARLNLARALWGQGKADEALAEVAAAMDMDPESLPAARLAREIREDLPRE